MTDVENQHWWDNPVLQEWVLEKPLQIALTLVVALIGHALLRMIIARAVDRGVRRAEGAPALLRVPFARPEQEQRRKARIRTLGAVGRSLAAIFIWTWAVLAVLTTLGVNVGPLIASAGVVGVALGFGAQSLVKDFLSGIFMLVEDQYGVGDTIDVGGVVGVVEDISLRVTTLRDSEGTVWYVRNGEILRVGNSSGEYAVARVEIPVALSNDPDHAWAVIEAAVDRAVGEPAVKDLILGEPELRVVSGGRVDQLSVHATVRTTPGGRWTVQRHLHSAVLREMQRAGIRTPGA